MWQRTEVYMGAADSCTVLEAWRPTSRTKSETGRTNAFVLLSLDRLLVSRIPYLPATVIPLHLSECGSAPQPRPFDPGADHRRRRRVGGPSHAISPHQLPRAQKARERCDSVGITLPGPDRASTCGAGALLSPPSPACAPVPTPGPCPTPEAERSSMPSEGGFGGERENKRPELLWMACSGPRSSTPFVLWGSAICLWPRRPLRVPSRVQCLKLKLQNPGRAPLPTVAC
ncbi:hypothetical protein OH77DRAFT_626001 [Trametes cingulata]|nr:hypothetical protein OH77DRAFT_626001 [Trametes cingulata]